MNKVLGKIILLFKNTKAGKIYQNLKISLEFNHK